MFADIKSKLLMGLVRDSIIPLLSFHFQSDDLNTTILPLPLFCLSLIYLLILTLTLSLPLSPPPPPTLLLPLAIVTIHSG